MNDRTEYGGELTLLFQRDGKAVLFEDDKPVWNSDADDEFLEQVSDEFLNADQDAESVLTYLASADVLDEDELPDVEVEQESTNGNMEPIETESEDGVHFKPVK